MDRVVVLRRVEKNGEGMEDDWRGGVAGKDDKNFFFIICEGKGAVVFTDNWSFDGMV